MTKVTNVGCDLHNGLSSDVKEIRANLVGKWIFAIIMGIFMAINSVLWVEMRSVGREIATLRNDFTLEIKSSLTNSEEKRDQILIRITDLSDQVSQLKGAMDAHMLMTRGK